MNLALLLFQQQLNTVVCQILLYRFLEGCWIRLRHDSSLPYLTVHTYDKYSTHIRHDTAYKLLFIICSSYVCVGVLTAATIQYTSY